MSNRQNEELIDRKLEEELEALEERENQEIEDHEREALAKDLGISLENVKEGSEENTTDSVFHDKVMEEMERKKASKKGSLDVLHASSRTRMIAFSGIALVAILGVFLAIRGSAGAQGSVVELSETVMTETTVVETEETKSQEELILEEVLASYQNLGIIQCNSYINFRSAPDHRDLSNIKGMLRNGAAVEVLEQNVEGSDGWAHVRSGGIDGYISSSYLLTGEEAEALVPDLIAMRATVLAEKLRIRSAPEIADGNTITSVAIGERYEIIEQVDEEWLKIKTDNLDNVEEAYISAHPDNVNITYCLDEARSLDLRQKVLNAYDNLAVSVAADYVNIRESMDTSGISNIVGKLPRNAGANILEAEDGWYKIQSGPVTGYVKAELLATGKTAEDLAVNHATVMAIVNTDSLNVRSEPNTDSAVWTSIVKSQRYNVVNQLDGWVQIELDAGDDEDSEQGAYVSTRDNNVTVTYALQEAIEYYPAVEAANAAMARRNEIANFAVQYVGNPYVWGGTSLTRGADCSGFVMTVLANFGISIPRTSRVQATAGRAVNSSDMKPGDLIFYANRSGTVNHVSMYIGNGQVVHAASRRSGIRISSWNYRTPVAIRNVID